MARSGSSRRRWVSAAFPLESLFDFYHADDNSRVWGAAFRCVYDGEVTLQEEEVESGAFMEVDARVPGRGHGTVHPGRPLRAATLRGHGRRLVSRPVNSWHNLLVFSALNSIFCLVY